MTKEMALTLIDNHKNKLTNPVDMLEWTWLRVIINQLTDDEWYKLIEKARPTLEC